MSSVVGLPGQVFTNWSSSQTCHPQLYFQPTSQTDLRQVLGKARLDSKKVKVVGCGYSSNGINCTEDYMISLKYFNNIIEIDRESTTVNVEAGILLSELCEILAQNGMALSVVGFISNMTLGAVLSTGYHGSGVAFGALEDYVLELSLLLASGEMLTLSDESNSDVFNAARLSLGSLGVIVSVKLQCERAFNLRQLSQPATLDDVADNIDSHLMSSDHFRFTWFPHTDRCTVFDISRTTESDSRPESNWFWKTFIGFNWLMQFLFWLSTLTPPIVAWINGLYSRLLSRRCQLTARSDRVFTFPCVVPNDCTEWAVPRSQLVSVLNDLRRLTDRASGGLYVHFPVDVRFVRRSSNCLLSPHGQSDAVYFNILAWRPYGKPSPSEKMFKSVEQLMLRYNGRPHWGKIHGLTSNELRTIYSSTFDRFLDIRNQLDPQRMFTNAYLKRVLGS